MLSAYGFLVRFKDTNLSYAKREKLYAEHKDFEGEIKIVEQIRYGVENVLRRDRMRNRAR